MDSHVFCNHGAIFAQSLRHFQQTSANVEYDAVYRCCKIPRLDSVEEFRRLSA
jgi:hypothetical protein